MMATRTPFATAAALLAAASIASSEDINMQNQPDSDHPYVGHRYVGMWITGDGHVRQELLANGRYDEARGTRRSAYQGRYEVRGDHIEYWDDTGFTADGDFVDGVLHHGGMIFYRDGKKG
jgi:hypothetical protein